MTEQSKSPGPIDAFLQSLGVEVEHPQQQMQKPAHIQVRAMLAYHNERQSYFLHCLILGSVTKNELEGELTQWQTTFTVETLRKFSDVLEQKLDTEGVRYRRASVLPPRAGDRLVSYTLLAPATAPAEEVTKVAAKVADLLLGLYRQTSGNLLGKYD